MHLSTLTFIFTIFKALLKEPSCLKPECTVLTSTARVLWKHLEEKGWAEGRALALHKHNFLSLQPCNIKKEGGLMLAEATAAQRAKGSALGWDSRSAGLYCCI